MSKRKRLHAVVAISAALSLAAGLATVSAGEKGRGQTARRVMPPNSHPYGKSYEEWVAEFWKWALALPVEGHPFLDDNPDYDFAANQSGKVWFWSAPDGPLTRHATVPAGTAIFLTVRDVEVSSLEEPPFFGATEEEQRERSAYFADRMVDVFVEIDGVPVENLEDYRFQSDQFEFTAPTPWVYGATGGAGTAVGDGYYLMLKPLPVGHHTIHYGGTVHLEPGELGDWQTEPLDLVKEITIELDVTK